MLTNQSMVLSTVGDFIGLAPIDWPAVTIEGLTQSKSGPVIDSTEYDVESKTLTRLQAFLQKHGMRYWETVEEQGHIGCHRKEAD